MKCPKCEYLGFETSDRCRNCGYEFSLAQPAAAEAFDLSLSEIDTALPPARQPLDLDRLIGGVPDDLPLFGGDPGEPAPLITTPSRPRAPLGVRRATPEVARARLRSSRAHEEMLFEPPPSMVPQQAGGDAAAAAGSRIAAALIDATLLLTLNAVVLYFTLRLCGLTASEILHLPATPLLAFLLLLDGGYFVAFTAVGGQSIGKMALGIKVVGDEDRAVPFGRATLRTFYYVLSALPLGAGFLPGVFGVERLALHDRLAHTRVIRPSAA